MQSVASYKCIHYQMQTISTSFLPQPDFLQNVLKSSMSMSNTWFSVPFNSICCWLEHCCASYHDSYGFWNPQMAQNHEWFSISAVEMRSASFITNMDFTKSFIESLIKWLRFQALSTKSKFSSTTIVSNRLSPTSSGRSHGGHPMALKTVKIPNSITEWVDTESQTTVKGDVNR